MSIHKGDYYEENNILPTSLSFQDFFLLSILFFYGVAFIFWEKRFIKGTFSSRYSIKTYEMMVRFLSPIFLYDQMCLNTFLLQMN